MPNFEMREERNTTSTRGAEADVSLTVTLVLLLTCVPHAACADCKSLKEGEESQIMSPLGSGGGLHTIIPVGEGGTEGSKPQTV